MNCQLCLNEMIFLPWSYPNFMYGEGRYNCENCKYLYYPFQNSMRFVRWDYILDYYLDENKLSVRSKRLEPKMYLYIDTCSVFDLCKLSCHDFCNKMKLLQIFS